MRTNNVGVLMMSKKFLVVLAFFGSAFVAAADGASTAAIDPVSMGRALGHETTSDPTLGPEAASQAVTTSSTDRIEDTVNSDAQITTKSESPVERKAETTQPTHGATTRPAVSEAAGDGVSAGAPSAAPKNDSGTSVTGAQITVRAFEATDVKEGASSTTGLGTFEATSGQSAGIDGVQNPGQSPKIASEKGATTESEMAPTTSSQGGGAGQAGSEKIHDSTVQAATSEADVVDEKTDVKVDPSTKTPATMDEDKLTKVSLEPPIDVTSKPQIQGDDSRLTVWEAHRGLFIGILIMVACVLVIGALCFVCFKCRDRSSSDKQRITLEEGVTVPMEASSPIPDAEMVKDEAPMQEVENPAVTPNGGGQHISKDEEDNGWVVPLEELSKTENEKPETENTKL